MKARMEDDQIELLPESEAESELLGWIAAKGTAVAGVKAIRLPSIGFVGTASREIGLSVSLVPKEGSG